MSCLACLMVILAFLKIILANTQTFNVYIPNDFPLTTGKVQDSDNFPAIALGNSNHKIQSFQINLNETFYIQLHDLNRNENYQLKLCWTSAYPVKIESMGYKIVPHHSRFLGTESSYARIFMYVKVLPDAYPDVDFKAVPVNISLTNIKMYIPVDLYSTLIYTAIVLGGTFMFLQRFNPYRLLKEL